MHTLLIEDLPMDRELDSEAMAAIQGGRMKLPAHLSIEDQIRFWDIDPAFL